jgi:hypothetical protein
MMRSDPYIYKGVHVSLIGHDIERIKELGQEVSLQVLLGECEADSVVGCKRARRGSCVSR